jgi:hypothetical protein
MIWDSFSGDRGRRGGGEENHKKRWMVERFLTSKMFYYLQVYRTRSCPLHETEVQNNVDTMILLQYEDIIDRVCWIAKYNHKYLSTYYNFFDYLKYMFDCWIYRKERVNFHRVINNTWAPLWNGLKIHLHEIFVVGGGLPKSSWLTI